MDMLDEALDYNSMVHGEEMQRFLINLDCNPHCVRDTSDRRWNWV
jgi:hypothetical protein